MLRNLTHSARNLALFYRGFETHCHRCLYMQSRHSYGLEKQLLVTQHQPYLMCQRWKSEKPIGKRKIELPQRVSYFTKKKQEIVGKFEAALKRKYPKAYKIYILGKAGLKDFFVDAKSFWRVFKRLRTGDPLTSFTWRELDNYRQIPSDMIHLGPVLISIPIPFAMYGVFPLSYLFPRHMLCRHFWTVDQRVEFALYYLKPRLQHYPKVFHYLERHSKDIRDEGQKRLFLDILHKLEGNSHPSVEELLEVQEVFKRRPFGANYLGRIHMVHWWHVAKSMGMSTRKFKIEKEFSFQHTIDMGILREGLQNITDAELQQLCFTRGMNAAGVQRKEMEDYMNQWLLLSKNVDASTMSLYLHAPVLLGYNRRSNVRYIGKQQNRVES